MSKNIYVLAVLAINFLAVISYLFFQSDKNRKNTFCRLPVIVQKLYVVFFIGPLFISPLIPQTRLTFQASFSISIAGAIFILVGLVFILFSFFKIGVVPSIRMKTHLITTGIYGIVRHPIYSGTLFTYLGISLISSAVISLLHFPIAVLLYYVMVRYEEKSLIDEYGQAYIDYSQKVRGRLIPFVF